MKGSKLKAWWVLLCLVVGSALPLGATIPSSERQALLALYNATNGDAWINNSGWLGPVGTECDWFGVGCDGLEQNVIRLDLQSNGMVGSLPWQIGNLSYLEGLWLGGPNEEASRNQLGGVIPSALAELTRLHVLSLQNNQFSGGIPPELSNLNNLELLQLSGNPLGGEIPPELGQLAKLRELWLGECGLVGPIPHEIGHLSSLRALVLWQNGLEGGIPAELGELQELEALALGWNPLGGPIPPELGQLKNLRSLYLWDNQLVGEIPTELGGLSQLVVLLLGVNQLQGSIPESFGNLAALEELNMPDNQISGGIPTQLGRLKNLRELHLEWNQLSGGIPAALGAMSSLQVLGLTGNRLSGEIPAALGDLGNLLRLYLGRNSIKGSLPSELTNLDNLGVLELQWNDLEGPIPVGLSEMSRLKLINLAGNHFSGELPPQLGSRQTLERLYLQGNLLQGEVPAELIQLVNLRDDDGLDLRWNLLYSSNPALIDFLDAKQVSGQWRNTQTLPPTDVVVEWVGSDAVELAWQPVVYTWDGGGTRVLMSQSPGGPYVHVLDVPDKAVSIALVEGLAPETQYYAVLQTVTEPNGINPNVVESTYSHEVAFLTDRADACVIDCAAVAPNRVEVGQAAEFSALVSTVNCAVAPEITWDFGDGSSAAGEVVTHQYQSSGRYGWELVASAEGARCDVGGEVIVSQVDTECGNGVCELGETAWNCPRDCGLGAEETGRSGSSSEASAIAAAVGGVSGVGGTFWLSEAMIHNPGDGGAQVHLRFTPDGQPEATSYAGPVVIAAGGAAFFGDFVSQVFGVSGSGSVIVEADSPVMVVSRTFNQQVDGTYGQFLGAVPARRILGVGDVAALIGLSETDSYRTNVLVQEVSGRSSTVELSVYNEEGTLQGVSPLELQPGTKLQKRLLNLGYEDLENGFATVEVVSGGQVVAVASVVDETTGDAMTVDAIHADQVVFDDSKAWSLSPWARGCSGCDAAKARAAVDFSWSPAMPSVGDEVAFTNLSEEEAVAFAWTFGDGGTSAQENPVHTYSEAGTYPVTLAISRSDFGSSFATKTITVQESLSFASSYLIPVVARSPGAEGTQWRSDLWILNPLSSAQDVRLEYRPDDDVSVRIYDVVVPAGQQVAVEDVVGTLFSGAGDGKGSLQIHASEGVMANSRTYNLGSEGTFGQAIPALGADDLIDNGVAGRLLKIKSTDTTRCNVGFTEMDGLGARVRLRVFQASAAGSTELASKQYTVPASTVLQINRVFADLGLGDTYEAAFAVVELVSGGRVYAYASNVDERTGDGEFIPAIIH